jgi:hypothetical protein
VTVTHQWKDTERVTADGKRLFRCEVCRRPTLVVEGEEPPAGSCAPVSFAELAPPCTHRRALLAKHGCCGSPITRIIGCEIFTACTVEANDGTLEWQGRPVTACEGCGSRVAVAEVKRDT